MGFILFLYQYAFYNQQTNSIFNKTQKMTFFSKVNAHLSHDIKVLISLHDIHYFHDIKRFGTKRNLKNIDQSQGNYGDII